MLIQIDFSSEEAIYQQLCNQIILGIATSQFTEGQALPSVRQLADAQRRCYFSGCGQDPCPEEH